MAEKIGLEAVFSLDQWSGNQKKYVSGLDKAASATDKAAGGMGKAWGQLGSSVTKTTAVLGGAVVAAAALAGAAIAKFTGDGISKAIDLDQKMADIAATLNKTKAEVQPLNDLILQLGIDPALKVSATEAAGAIEILAKNGLTMTEIMDGAAKATVLLSNATGADFNTSADIATSAMQIFNIEAKDMITAVNGITSVTVASKFDMNDYALAIAQGGAVAANAGVSFDDFNTTIAAISPNFASGSDAGTSFKSFMNSLTPSTEKARDAMYELGLMTTDWDKASQHLNITLDDSTSAGNQVFEAFKRMFATQTEGKGTTEELQEAWAGFIGNFDDSAFYDATGNMEDMNQVSVVLNESLKDLTEEQRALALETLFGTDGSRAAIGLAEAGQVVYTDLAKAVKETGLAQDILTGYMKDGELTAYELMQAQQGLTDANAQAATRMDTVAGAMEIFSGVVETLQIQIGQAFLPVIKQMVEMFTAFVGQHSPAIIAAFQAFAENVVAVVNVIVSLVQGSIGLNEALSSMHPVLASVVLGFGGLVVGVQAAADLIANTIGQYVQWKDVLVALGIVIASIVIPAIIGMIAAMSPLILIFGAIVAGVALARMAWESNFLGIQDITASVMAAVQAAIGPIIAVLSDLAGRVLPWVQQNWQALALGIGGFVAVLAAAQLPVVFAAISASVTAATTAIGVALAALNLPLLAVAGAVALLAVAWTGNWFGIQEVTFQAIENIKSYFAPLTTAIQEFGSQALTEIWSFVTGNAIGFTALGAIWTVAQQMASNLFTSIVGYVQTNLPIWTANLVSWGLAASQWIVDATVIVATKMTEWGTAIFAYVIGRLPVWQTQLMAWATAAWQWIVDAAGQVGTKLGEWYTALKTSIDSKLPALKSTLLSWATAAWQWIVDAASQLGAKITEWYTSLKTGVDAKLIAFKSALVPFATVAWQWIIDAAGQVGTKITEWYTKLKSEIDNKLPALKSTMLAWATAAWQWIIDAAGLVGAKITEWYNGLKAAIDAKLPTWKLAFMEWRIATTQWLADSIALIPAKIAEWYTGLATNISAKLPSFKTEMLKFATGLVEWIGSSAANALPKLGTWFGKIVAWIPLAVIALGVAAIKLATALVSWIAGGEGGTGESAVSKTDPEMEKLKQAFITAIGNVWTGLKGIVQNFAQSFWDTINEHVDWEQLGKDILNAVRTGFESIRDSVYLAVTLFINRVQKLFNPEEWKRVGEDVLEWIQEGWESIEATFLLAVTGLIADMKKKFTDSISAFTQIGKDIIQGVIDGIAGMKEAILDKIREIAGALPEWFRQLLGIASPSKVFMEFGVNIIQGLINGMESMKSHLRNSVGRLVGGFVSTLAGQMLAGPRNMLAEFGKLSSDFMSAAGEWADAVQALTGDGTEDNPASAALDMLGAQQGITDNLQRQLKLVDLIRAAGKDPAQFIGVGVLGRNADPVMMMTLLTQAAEDFNNQLEHQLRIATLGYDTLINDLRTERQEIAQIEDLALRPTLRGVDFIRSQIDDLDNQIAKAEQNLLNTGQSVYAAQLRQLHGMRQMRAAELSDYIKLWHQVESTVEQAAGFAESLTSERGAEQAKRFVDSNIRPLMDTIQTPGATMDQRNIWLSMINERVTTLARYGGTLKATTALEEKFNRLAEDSNFGETIARNTRTLLSALYEPLLENTERNRITKALNSYHTTVTSMMSVFNRLSAHSVFGDVTRHLTPYLNKLLDINTAEAERLQAAQDFNRIAGRLQAAQQYDQITVDLQERLDLLNKIKALAAGLGSSNAMSYILGSVDLMAGPLNPDQWKGVILRYSEQAMVLASKELRDALRPDLTKQFNAVIGDLRSFDQIMKDFNQTPIGDLERAQQYLDYYDSEIERLRGLAAAGHQYAVDQGKATRAARDQTIAWIRTYMDALVKADRHVARIQETTDERGADIATTFRENLIDPLRAMMEKNIGADYRASLITQIGQRVDQLNSYVRQIGRLSNLQKDLSDIIGFNPLVARFAELRLDPLLTTIYDINTAEAERNRLVQIYRQEQEKLLRLQEKMAQLEFLQMQLSLLDEMRQLAEEFPNLVNIKDIFGGMTLGAGASLDSLIAAVGKAIETLIRVTNEKLKISSPSKVFAKIGEQMMAGLGVGIQSSIMQPIGALRSAISDIPYALQGRSLAVNMGGVTINNGMDDVLFEARVRQIIDKAF